MLSKLGEFNNSIKNISWKLKTLKGEKVAQKLQITLASYKSFQKHFNEGIFQTKLCNVMYNMELQCQVCHNGAPVSNDVHKLTKNENISYISTVFKPLLINYQII